MVTRLITEDRSRFGVEPMCRVLTQHGVCIAPTTYLAATPEAGASNAWRRACTSSWHPRFASCAICGRDDATIRVAGMFDEVARLLAADEDRHAGPSAATELHGSFPGQLPGRQAVAGRWVDSYTGTPAQEPAGQGAGVRLLQLARYPATELTCMPTRLTP